MPVYLNNQQPIHSSGTNAFRPAKEHFYDPAYQEIRKDPAFIAFCQSKQLDPAQVGLEFEQNSPGSILIRLVHTQGNFVYLPDEDSYTYVRDLARYILLRKGAFPSRAKPVPPIPSPHTPSPVPFVAPVPPVQASRPQYPNISQLLQTILHHQAVREQTNAQEQKALIQALLTEHRQTLLQMQQASEQRAAQRDTQFLTALKEMQDEQGRQTQRSAAQFGEALLQFLRVIDQQHGKIEQLGQQISDASQRQQTASQGQTEAIRALQGQIATSTEAHTDATTRLAEQIATTTDRQTSALQDLQGQIRTTAEQQAQTTEALRAVTDQIRTSTAGTTDQIQRLQGALETALSTFERSLQDLSSKHEHQEVALLQALQQQAAILRDYPQQLTAAIQGLQQNLQASFTSSIQALLTELRTQGQTQQGQFAQFSAAHQQQLQAVLHEQAQFRDLEKQRCDRIINDLNRKFAATTDHLERLYTHLTQASANPQLQAVLQTLQQSQQALVQAVQGLHHTQDAVRQALEQLRGSLSQPNSHEYCDKRLKETQDWARQTVSEAHAALQQLIDRLPQQPPAAPQAAPPPRRAAPAPDPRNAAAPSSDSDDSPRAPPRDRGAIRGLQEQNRKLQTTIDDLQKQLIDSQAIRQERDRLLGNQEGLRRHHTEQARELGQLRPALDDARLQLEQLNQRSRQLEAQLVNQGGLQTEITRLKAEVERLKPLEQAIARLQEALTRGELDKADLQRINTLLKDQLRIAQDQLRSQEANLAQLSARVKELEEARSALLSQQDTNRLENERLQHSLQQQTQELRSLRQRFEQQEASLTEANMKTQELHSANRMLQSQIDQFAKERSHYEGQIREKEEHISSLQKELRQLGTNSRNQQAKLQAQLTEEQTQKETLQRHLDQLNQKLQAGHEQIKSLQAQLQEKTSQNLQTQAAASQKETANQQLRRRVAELESQILQLRTQIDLFPQKEQALQSKLQEQHTLIRELSSRLEQQKSLYQQSQQRLHQLQGVEASLQQKEIDIGHLKAQLQDLRSHYESTQKTIGQLQTTLHKEKEEAARQKTQLLDQNLQLKLQIQELESRLRNESAQKDQLNRLISSEQLQRQKERQQLNEQLEREKMISLDLQQQISHLKSEKQSVEEKLRSSLAQIQALEGSRSSTNEASLRSDIETLQRTIQSLQSRQNLLQGALSEAETTKAQQAQQIQRLQEQLEQKENEHRELEYLAYYPPNPLLEQHEREIAQATAREQELQKQIGSLETRLEQAAGTIQETEALRETIRIQDEQLDSLRHLPATTAQMRAHITHLQRHNEQLLGQLQQRPMNADEIARIQEQLRLQAERIQALSQERDSLLHTIEIAEEQNQQERQTSQTQITTLTDQKNQMGVQQRALEEHIAALSTTQGQLQAALHQSQQELQRLQSQQQQRDETLISKIEEQKRRISEQATDLSLVTEELTSSKEERNRMEEQLKQLTQQNAALKKTIETQISSFAELATKQGLEAKARIQQLETQLSDAHREVERYRTKIREIVDTMPALTQKIRTATEERARLTQELEQLKQRVQGPNPGRTGDVFQQLEASEQKARSLEQERNRLAEQLEAARQYRTQRNEQIDTAGALLHEQYRAVERQERLLTERKRQLEELTLQKARLQQALHDAEARIHSLEEKNRAYQMQTALGRSLLNRGSAGAIPHPVAPAVVPIVAQVPLPALPRQRRRARSLPAPSRS